MDLLLDIVQEPGIVKIIDTYVFLMNKYETQRRVLGLIDYYQLERYNMNGFEKLFSRRKVEKYLNYDNFKGMSCATVMNWIKDRNIRLVISPIYYKNNQQLPKEDASDVFVTHTSLITIDNFFNTRWFIGLGRVSHYTFFDNDKSMYGFAIYLHIPLNDTIEHRTFMENWKIEVGGVMGVDLWQNQNLLPL